VISFASDLLLESTRAGFSVCTAVVCLRLGLTPFSSSSTEILMGAGLSTLSGNDLATLLQSTSLALPARGMPRSSSLKHNFAQNYLVAIFIGVKIRAIFAFISFNRSLCKNQWSLQSRICFAL